MKPEFEKKHLRKFKYRTKRILGTKKNISAKQLWKNQRRTSSLLKHKSVKEQVQEIYQST